MINFLETQFVQTDKNVSDLKKQVLNYNEVKSSITAVKTAFDKEVSSMNMLEK